MLKSALDAQMARLSQKAQSRSERFQRNVEQLLAKIAGEHKASIADGYSYAHSIMSCSLLRAEILFAVFVIFLLAISTSIFFPFGITDSFTRISVVSIAMLLGAALSAGLLFALLPLHLLKNISLWSIAAIHSFVSAGVFSLAAPELVQHFLPSQVPTFLEIFEPFFLLNGLFDIFVLWRFKPQICLRTFKQRHRAETIKDLLPGRIQSAVWAISAADHYIEILTEHGRHMHRMTMKSAIAKTDPAEGLRVHRSHWVAYSAMLSLKKERERFFLTMRNGDHIPVSTKMAPAIKMYLDHGQLLAAE